MPDEVLHDPERPSWMPDPSGTAAASSETPPPSPGEGLLGGQPATPDGFIGREEFDRLREELDQERASNRQSRAWGEDLQHRYQVETAVRQELERMYRQHAEATQQAAHLQPPAAEGVEDWLVEPQGIAAYVARYGAWMRETLLAQLSPFLQRLALYDGVLPTVLSRAAEDSMSHAKRTLEEEGVTDFDELRGEIEQAFGANPAGARLILDPSTVASVYHYLARQRSVKPVKAAAKPIPTAGVSREKGRPPSAALSPAVRQIADRLQINPTKLAQRIAARRSA